MPDAAESPQAKAELAAAARAKKRHAAEAAALRANLLRRKQQARAREKPAEDEKCR